MLDKKVPGLHSQEFFPPHDHNQIAFGHANHATDGKYASTLGNDSK